MLLRDHLNSSVSTEVFHKSRSFFGRKREILWPIFGDLLKWRPPSRLGEIRFRLTRFSKSLARCSLLAIRQSSMASGEIVLSISKAEEQTHASTWILLARRGIIDAFGWETHLYLGSLMRARACPKEPIQFQAQSRRITENRRNLAKVKRNAGRRCCNRCVIMRYAVLIIRG